jgi:MFS family permease
MTGGKMNVLRALSHSPFALLWGGQTISRLGDSLYRIALAWWVFEQTGSAATMGAVLICFSVPLLLFLLVGGVTVDRVSRLTVMLVADGLRTIIAGAIAVLSVTQLLEVWHIYVASVAFGVVSAFFQPAYQASVPDITPPELLPSANSLTNLSAEVLNIVGPGLGALLIRYSGTEIVFVIEAVTFLIAALSLIPLIGRVEQKTPSTPSKGILGDLREGLETVRVTPWLWVTIAIFTLGGVTHASPLAVTLPFLIGEALSANVDVLGLFLSAMSAGSVAAAVWLGRASKLRRRGPFTYVASIISGLALLAVGLPIGIIGLAGAALVIGATVAAINLIWINTLQELVPRERLGRILSIEMLGSWALLPVGYALVGWLTDRVGAPWVFIVGGTLTTLLSCLGFLHPAIWRLD